MAGHFSLVHVHGERIHVMLRVPRIVRTGDSMRERSVHQERGPGPTRLLHAHTRFGDSKQSTLPARTRNTPPPRLYGVYSLRPLQGLGLSVEAAPRSSGHLRAQRLKWTPKTVL